MTKIWRCEYCRNHNPDLPVSSNLKFLAAITECRSCGAPREIDVELMDPRIDVLVTTGHESAHPFPSGYTDLIAG